MTKSEEATNESKRKPMTPKEVEDMISKLPIWYTAMELVRAVEAYHNVVDAEVEKQPDLF